MLHDYFDNLPDDMVSLIFDNLNLADLTKTALVCKRFCKESSHSARLAKLGIFKFRTMLVADYIKSNPTPEEMINEKQHFHKLQHFLTEQGLQKLDYYQKRKSVYIEIKHKEANLKHLAKVEQQKNEYLVSINIIGFALFIVLGIVSVAGTLLVFGLTNEVNVLLSLLSASFMTLALVCSIPMVMYCYKNKKLTTDISTLKELEEGLSERSPLLVDRRTPHPNPPPQGGRGLRF